MIADDLAGDPRAAGPDARVGFVAALGGFRNDRNTQSASAFELRELRLDGGSEIPFVSGL
jgi:hypothetical protein